MKKIVLSLIIGVLISAYAASGQAWTEYPSPVAATTEAIYVGAENLYIFGNGKYYQAPRPTVNQADITWQEFSLPKSLPIKEALQFNGQLFVIFSNQELWQKDYYGWKLAQTNVLSMDATSSGAYFYTAYKLFVYSLDNLWGCLFQVDNAQKIALNNDWVLFFAPSSVEGITHVYKMRTLGMTTPEFLCEMEIDLSSVSMSKTSGDETDGYLVGGQNTGLAVFRSCQVNSSCQNYLLSAGRTNSVFAGAKPWVAGELMSEGETKGFILNAQDFSSLFITDQSVKQITGGGDLVAAITDNGLFLRWEEGQYLDVPIRTDDKTTKKLFNVYPSPNDGIMTVQAEKDTEFRLYDLSGRLVYSEYVTVGQHKIETNLSPGIYIFEQSNKIIVTK